MVDQYLTQNINAISQSKLGKELNYQKNDLAISKKELQALIKEAPRESKSPGDKNGHNLNLKKSADFKLEELFANNDAKRSEHMSRRSSHSNRNKTERLQLS